MHFEAVFPVLLPFYKFVIANRAFSATTNC